MLERQKRLLTTQCAVAKEAARKDRVATRTIEAEMAELLKVKKPKPELEDPRSLAEMKLWLEVMSIELSFSRVALDIYKSKRAAVVLYSWYELRRATRDFNVRYAACSGDFGELYYTQLPDHDQNVVIKKLGRDLGDCNITNVIQMISMLQHPHLQPILGLGISDMGMSRPKSSNKKNEKNAGLCVVYSQFEGGSLLDSLSGVGVQLSPEDRVRVLSEVCMSLHFLHSQTPPCIHGNLKSSNILIPGEESKDEVHVTDYVLHALSGNKNYTSIYKKYVGSSQYADPLVDKAGEFSTKSDVYSFGVIILECLLGSLPPFPLTKFATGLKDQSSLMQAVDTSCGPWDPDLAVLLQRIAMTCLSLDNDKLPTAVIRPKFQEIRAQLGSYNLEEDVSLDALDVITKQDDPKEEPVKFPPEEPGMSFHLSEGLMF